MHYEDRCVCSSALFEVTVHRDSTPVLFNRSTEDIPQRQKLDSYVGTICDNLIHVTMATREHADFYAAVSAAALGALKVSEISGSQHDAYRTQKDIANSSQHA